MSFQWTLIKRKPEVILIYLLTPKNIFLKTCDHWLIRKLKQCEFWHKLEPCRLSYTIVSLIIPKCGWNYFNAMFWFPFIHKRNVDRNMNTCKIAVSREKNNIFKVIVRIYWHGKLIEKFTNSYCWSTHDYLHLWCKKTGKNKFIN